MRDIVEAVAGVGVVVACCAPIVYALWRARDAPQIARIPHQALRTWLVIASVISAVLFVGINLASGVSSNRVMKTLALVILGGLFWLATIMLVRLIIDRRRR